MFKPEGMFFYIDNIESFWTNPQYRISVTDIDDDDDDDLSTVIIGVMQKERRKMRTAGKDNVTMGYCVYEVRCAEFYEVIMQ